MKPVILCVDDEKIVLDSLTTQLRNAFHDDFHYEQAQNTAEAREILEEILEEKKNVVLIISDWLMPIEKGDQFLIDVSANLPYIPLIMLSGHADDESVIKAKKYSNLKLFVRKPWDKAHFMTQIRNILHGQSS